MSEQELVKKCLAGIFLKNGYENLSDLRQRDFEHASEQIEKTTGTMISVSTLKRLLNGDFSRQPQTATLNAISRYQGYEGWQAYKAALRSSQKIVEGKDVPNETILPVANGNRRFRWGAAILLLIVAGAVVGFIGYSGQKKNPHFDKATFGMNKITTNEIPNTVVFTYNVDDVNADSFFIQQSWDRKRRVQVYPGHHTLTDIYYEPGYHVAKLMAGDSVIRTIDVSIPTKGWFFTAKENIHSNPEYIKAARTWDTTPFALARQDLVDSHIDITKEKEYAYLYFPEKHVARSDSYTLKCRLRVKPVKNNPCPYFMIEVFCQRNFMYFKGMSKGCASESIVQFGEQRFSGKQHDLSAFGCDVSQWTNAEISIMNKKVTIKLNDLEVFSTAYKTNTGLITGLGFMSNGLCEIEQIDLRGNDGQVVFSDGLPTNQ